MSTTIDNRIVEMRFDNKQFESNVQTTLSTLDKLKQSLNLTGASKGFENINSAARNVNLSGISNAVETVGIKFNAMYSIADQALRNITNTAVNYGKRIASALTIDPIKTGFSEYETKMGAIQTIMSNTASKGTTMQDVTRVINELNTYADKTIYNFAEMTRNIGTFTAAGVDLEDAAAAIQGIANLAAASGSTSQQASTAMYQLSQALSSGTVKLMDWNSVVNAGMGGEKFQEALKATARDHGVAVDDMIKKNGSFRESLREEWITADILNETLNKFTVDGAKNYAKSMMESGKWTQEQADALIKEAQAMEDAATKVKTFTQLCDTLKESAQSGWAQTWEIIVGDFDEAKSLFTEISDTIGGMLGKSADSRNELLSGALSTGWKQLLGEGIDDAAGFEEMVSKVAKEHGVKLDEMIDDETTFQDTLKEGWLNGDILTESVAKFTEELSGMSEKELEAAGYTKETVDKLKELKKQVDDGSISMEEFAKRISRPSGRELLIESLWNAFKGLMSVVEPIKEAFNDIFPKPTVDQLYSLIQTLHEFSKKLTLSETNSKNLKRTFKGVFAVLDIGVELFKAIAGGVADLVKFLLPAGNGILELTGDFGDYLVKLRDVIKETDFFGDIVGNVVGFIKSTITIIKNAATALKDFGSSIADKINFSGWKPLHSFLERVHARMSQVGDAASEMKSSFSIAMEFMGDAIVNSNIFKAFQSLWNGIKAIGSAIGKMVGSIFDSIGEANFSGILDLINTASIGGIAIFITKFVKGFSDVVDDIGNIKESVIGILDEVKGCFEAYQTQLKAGALLKIAGAIAILAASILVISLIDSKKLTASLGAITVLFGELMGSMAIFTRLSGDVTGVTKAVTAMIGISLAVLILASALKKISSVDPGNMFAGLIGIFGLTMMMVQVSKTLGKETKTIIKGAAQMVIFAVAIKVLASAVIDLSSLNWNQLLKGLVGVGVLLAEVSLFLNTAKFSGKSISTAMGIVILAAAMKVMASACKDFGSIPTDTIVKGLTAIGAILAEVALFTNASGHAKHVVSTAVSLVIIGAAMKIFANVIQDYGNMPWETIGKGLLGMAASLAIVALAVNAMPSDIILIGPGLIAVGAALSIISKVLDRLGYMSWESIAKSMVALGGSLAIIALGVNAMKGAMGGAAAILVVSASLAILTPVLSILGAMSWESIAKGLVSIAGAFAVIGIAGLVLQPLVPTILGLAGAFALVGVGVVAIGAGLVLAGAGLSAVAIGITALAASLSAGVTAIVAGLSAIIVGIADLIPLIIQKLGEGIIALCKVIIDGAPAICEAAKAIIVSLVKALVESVPVIVDGALVIVSSVLSSLVEHTPQIVELLFNFLIAVLDGIAKKLPDLIQSAVGVIMSFFQGVIDALGGIDTSVLLKGIAGVGLLSAMMVALAALALLTPAAMVGVLGFGLVLAELSLVLAAVGALSKIPGLEWLINEGAGLMQAIGNSIGSLIGGLIGGIMGGVSSMLPKIATDLSEFMTNIQPFINGIKMVDASVLAGVGFLSGAIVLLTAADLIAGIGSFLTGGSTFAQLGTDLSAFMMNAMPFIMGAKMLNAEMMAGVGALAETILILTAANVLEGISSFISGGSSLSTFSEQLPGLGTNISQFAANLGTFDETKMATVACAANAIKSIAQAAQGIPNEGGWLAKIVGDNSVETFGAYLPGLGKNISEFASNLGTFDEAKVMTVTCAANAIKSMAEAAQGIPNEGGWLAKIVGDNSIATFGGYLPGLGKNLSEFATNLGTFDDTKVNTVTCAANAIKAMSEAAAGIPNEGGWLAKIVGDNGIETFGGYLPGLGTNLSEFATNLGTFDETKIATVTCAANAIKAMATVAESLPNEGGWLAKIVGDNSIATFGGYLPGLGTNLNEFATNLGTFDDAKVATVNASVKAIQAIATLSGIDLGDAASGISKFGGKLGNFAEDLAGFCSSMAEVDTASVTTAVNSVKKISTMIRDLEGIDSSAATNFSNALNELGKSGVDSFVTAFTSQTSKTNVKKAATDLINTFVDGMESKLSSVKNSMTKLVTDAIPSLKNETNYGKFKSAGSYLVDGFAAGISENTYKAEAKAKAMAEAAEAAAKEALDINSPSKVFRSIGYSVPEGFAMGIDKLSNMVSKSAINMSNGALDNVKQAINRISDVVSTDVDSQPTIRPVLDLSDVRNGASAINGLFTNDALVGVRANVSSISSSMNGNIQNGDSEIVSAINKLRKDLGNVGNTTYQINGITYDDGSALQDAFGTIVRQARMERRV